MRKRFTQAVKDRWLEDLRSGNYRQGTGELSRFEEGHLCYCCLGVLGEQLGVQKRDSEFLDYGFLPEKTQTHLAKLNDDGMPFEEIADYIEENVPVEADDAANS